MLLRPGPPPLGLKLQTWDVKRRECSGPSPNVVKHLGGGKGTIGFVLSCLTFKGWRSGQTCEALLSGTQGSLHLDVLEGHTLGRFRTPISQLQGELIRE
jgi:hypothetical protein